MLTPARIKRLTTALPYRSRELFTEFLPRGYMMTTLSSVSEPKQVVRIKVLLGAIITLFDDFADNPEMHNPPLLAHMYRLPLSSNPKEAADLSLTELGILELADDLLQSLFFQLAKLPGYPKLRELFLFDLQQFFSANHYCELLTADPNLRNDLENKIYLHHNMGIVMAGMIDLMSLPQFRRQELGQIRKAFLLGQRIGRIANVITTLDRELTECDYTNEIIATSGTETLDQKRLYLQRELQQRLSELHANEGRISAFSVGQYAAGMENLFGLHQDLKAVI